MMPIANFTRRPARLSCLGLMAWFFLCLASPAFVPGTSDPNAVQGFVVDTSSRMDVLAFYHTVYSASENYAAHLNWTGDTPTGVAGTTGVTFKDDVRRRINFYRALAGLPADITFDATKNAKCQQAALMMSRNNELDHTPPASWTFYTANGAEAAGKSNLSLGVYGPAAINGLMVDPGSGNEIVGHRRWLLYSRAQSMGTGDVPADDIYPAANANWVIGDEKPVPTPKFVAWPNRGFCPFPLMPARWSLSYPNAGFGSATVTMTRAGNNVPLTVISRIDNGYGDNTIVWTPTGLPSAIQADTAYNITVSGITGAGVPTSFTYTVTLFDPNVLGDAVTVSGPATPPPTGAAYTFNSIAQADAYELRVASGSLVAWKEGAEDAPVPQIQSLTTGSYNVRQSAVKRTDAKAFQLAFGDPSDQSFIVTRDLIPSSTSALQFYDLGRFATTTTTLGAEVSTDGGNTWTNVFSRPGVGLSSGNFDPAFVARNISLAAYAGQIVRVRFILRGNGASYVPGADANAGFFIDDITITNGTELIDPAITALPGSAMSFDLNTTTAGAALTVGKSYYLQLRPQVGTRFFGYGPAKIVTVQPATGYAGWVAANYPAVTGSVLDDHDRDGLRNGIEYAYGHNPTTFNPASALPQPTRTGNLYGVTFTQPPGVTGVTYGADWSTDLLVWTPIPDTGTGGNHIFRVDVTGEPKVFFRHHLIFTP